MTGDRYMGCTAHPRLLERLMTLLPEGWIPGWAKELDVRTHLRDNRSFIARHGSPTERLLTGEVLAVEPMGWLWLHVLRTPEGSYECRLVRPDWERMRTVLAVSGDSLETAAGRCDRLSREETDRRMRLSLELAARFLRRL